MYMDIKLKKRIFKNFLHTFMFNLIFIKSIFYIAIYYSQFLNIIYPMQYQKSKGIHNIKISIRKMQKIQNTINDNTCIKTDMQKEN